LEEGIYISIGRSKYGDDVMAPHGKPTIADRMPKTLDEGIDVAMKHVNYPMWFSDQMAKGYVGMFPVRFSMCKNDEEKEKILFEAQMTASLYAVLVYYRYNERSDFRSIIDSKPELAENFKMIKAWLDKRDGKAAADEFIELFKKEALAAKGAESG